MDGNDTAQEVAKPKSLGGALEAAGLKPVTR